MIISLIIIIVIKIIMCELLQLFRFLGLCFCNIYFSIIRAARGLKR